MSEPDNLSIAEARLLHLTQGFVTVVDEVDAPMLAQHRWCAKRTKRDRPWVYAVRVDRAADGRRRTVFMHRVILEAMLGHADFELVDHINGDRLDNRRANLRPATDTQNARNARPCGGSSQYRGVSWCRRREKWRAVIVPHHRRQRYIGQYDSEDEAARAYDRVARAAFGEFAYLNFPEEQ